MICNDMEPGSHQLGDTDQLVLRSKLSDMERLSPWIDGIASTFGLEDRLRFAIRLCLEEAVSNVIRHGYANKEGELITVHCAECGDDQIVFTVEDDAAPFNPFEVAELPGIGSQDTEQSGGQGIRLLRGFADTLEYEPKPGGNRLRIGFCITAPSLSNRGTPN